MRLVIEDSQARVALWVATYVRKRINDFAPTPAKPFVLGLPTGSSPLLTYQKLIEFHRAGTLSFANVVTFNMDEYVNLTESHPESYHAFMWTNLFQHVDIRYSFLQSERTTERENVHILNGNASDLKAECEEYERKILAFGGIELFLGGIGPDGHIAFNEPGSSLASRTRVKTLAYDTIVANSRFFGGDIKQVPTMALTVGVGTVMDAREVLVIITGIAKAYALYKVVEEGVNHMWTVSMIQQHPNACIGTGVAAFGCCCACSCAGVVAMWESNGLALWNRVCAVCDEDATAELRVKTVKYFKGLYETHAKLIMETAHS